VKEQVGWRMNTTLGQHNGAVRLSMTNNIRRLSFSFLLAYRPPWQQSQNRKINIHYGLIQVPLCGKVGRVDDNLFEGNLTDFGVLNRF
jgi:hypothetical protein